jgi:hypothetical protein
VADPEDNRRWCHQCDYGSEDPTCLFCGAPLIEPASGVLLHEGKTYRELHVARRQLSGAMRRIVTGS